MTTPDLSTNRSAGTVRLLAAAAAIVCLTGLGLAAQFRTGVDLVELYVSAVDDAGAPLEDLKQRDFEVYEDGRRKEISVFSAGGVPLALAVALDRSFSVAGRPLSAMKSAVAGLLGDLRGDDSVLLLGIGSRVDVLSPLGTDRAAQTRALASVDAFGSTSLHDAIVVAVDLIQRAPGRRALILLSDGVDRYSGTSAEEVVAHVNARDVLVFPVAVGAAVTPLFTDVATATGGRAFAVRDPSGLSATLRTLAGELRAQYLLGYVPRPAASREWRTIRVTVKRRGVTVRTRQGYWTSP